MTIHAVLFICKVWCYLYKTSYLDICVLNKTVKKSYISDCCDLAFTKLVEGFHGGQCNYQRKTFYCFRPGNPI